MTNNSTITVHQLDAKGQTLGRFATKIANLLRGKNKVGFVYNLDIGDKVVVINPELIRVTGRKLSQKMYYRHSGYPGGLKEISLEKLLQKKPEDVIKLAVKRMLPDNRLRAGWMKKLEIRKGA